MRNEVEMHRIDAIQMRRVKGCSKLNSLLPLYCASEMAWLMKYDTPDMKSIRKRIAKIQTMSLAWMSRKLVVCVFLSNKLNAVLGGSLKMSRMADSLTARVMKVMRATPVTP